MGRDWSPAAGSGGYRVGRGVFAPGGSSMSAVNTGVAAASCQTIDFAAGVLTIPIITVFAAVRGLAAVMTPRSFLFLPLRRINAAVSHRHLNLTMSTFNKLGIQTGCKTLSSLTDWPGKEKAILDAYRDSCPGCQLTEINLDLAFFIFDLVGERVALTYAFSTPALTKRDASRIRGFPNVNATVQRVMGEKAFPADKGHFLGHASGGSLDINLFPQRRDLNRGWSEQGKRYRAMERYVAEHSGTFFYHRPIYDDDTWLPDKLEFAIHTNERGWWVDVFNNK